MVSPHPPPTLPRTPHETAISLRIPLLCLVAAAVPALDQLDLPVAAQWYAPLRERPVLRVASAWGAEESADVRGSDASLARDGGYVTASGRAWRGERSEAWLRLTGVDLRLDGDAALPVTGPLPDRLQDLRLGGFWRMATAGGAIVGLDAEVSSPSDDPYSDSDVLGVGATAFARIPTTGMDAWTLLLRYDSTSTLLSGVPIPGVGYQWIRPGLLATVGIPFVIVDWRPIDDWSFSASYFPIDAGNIGIRWSPGSPAAAPGPARGPWSIGPGMSVSYENWFRADRPDEDVRLTFRTVRAFVVGEWKPSPPFALRLALGRILLREVYETEDWSHRDENRFRTDPAWYGSLGASAAF